MDIFAEKAASVLECAKYYSVSSGSSEIGLKDIFYAVLESPEGIMFLADCLDLSVDILRDGKSITGVFHQHRNEMPLSEEAKKMLALAQKLSVEVPDRLYPALIAVRHIAAALAMTANITELYQKQTIDRTITVALLNSWDKSIANAPGLDELIDQIRNIRCDLLEQVFGQDHAVYAFTEALFDAEVVAAADKKRRGPRSVFIFAGPPGVGKTYLAELGASMLERPVKRFDMSAYSGTQQNEALIGMAKSYSGANAGILTDFVSKNPYAVLIFDEIEKAHRNTIHLFLQLLDVGVLEDKFYEREVLFQNTTVIFTTNAGRRLYDRPNESGVHTANAAFHRKTVLDALASEKNPETNSPYLPEAICSRLSTGYPVLFNYLRINELVRVVSSGLKHTGELLQRQYCKEITFDERLPMALVLREGGRPDARLIRAQSERFLKTELMKLCELYSVERLQEALGNIDCINFTFDSSSDIESHHIHALFESIDRPKVLILTDDDLVDLYRENISEVEWHVAACAEQALMVLATEDIDLVLLDLWLGGPQENQSETMLHFDHVPAASGGLDHGQEILYMLHKKHPGVPVYLLSLSSLDIDEHAENLSIDDELFGACVRGGGARGMLISYFVDGLANNWKIARQKFTDSILSTCLKLHREKTAEQLGLANKVLDFDTVPHTSGGNRTITIELRNFRLTRALAAADAGEVLDDVERPTMGFSDVIGADAAKDELLFFVDYLKNPKKFTALGMKPLKGVLLHGPPGTGKTMLARALAGESDVAFISTTATNFVTIWQGSGPQNVRDLFNRARRYAPSIIFIDEIDAIGRARTGGMGGTHAAEDTLNALLSEMDGFVSQSPERPVFILAATNFMVDGTDRDISDRQGQLLDPALVRRFSRAVLVDLPVRQAREEYLNRRLKSNTGSEVTPEMIQQIAERASGLSMSDLEMIIETALRNCVKSDHYLTDEALEEAFENTQYGESHARSHTVVERTARHEAGHAFLYWLSGHYPSYVTVVSRGGHGGYMARSAADMEDRSSKTRAELLSDVRMMLGGRAAEIVYYGEDDGLTSGASQDLENATNLVRTMVCRYGMDREFGVLSAPELTDISSSSSASLEVNRIVSRILDEQMKKSIDLLNKNKAKLESIASSLIEKERLNREDIVKILG